MTEMVKLKSTLYNTDQVPDQHTDLQRHQNHHQLIHENQTFHQHKNSERIQKRSNNIDSQKVLWIAQEG